MSRRAYVKQSMVGKISTNKKERARAALAQQRANFRQQVTTRSSRQAAMLYASPRHRENKFFDTVPGSASKQLTCASDGAVSNSAGGYLLNGAAVPAAMVINQIPQGTTQNTRLGRRARITGVHIKGYALAGVGNGLRYSSLNLVHQVPPNNPTTMPPFADIWVSQHPGALRVVDNADKIKLLRSLGPHNNTGNGTTAVTGLELEPIDEMIDLKAKNIITEWTQADTTGTYSNMEKGALMLYALGNLATASNPNSYLISCRVYFEDY